MSAGLGETLGRYEIVGTLGRGAMGTVYDARDPGIGRRVAIKTLPLHGGNGADIAEELARFRREAQAAGRLHHPNVVGVYDYGETADVAYIVMEYVDGSTLKALFDAGERFAPADAVRLMQGLLAAMQYCHERGVVHRDIKPGNVMLAREPPGGGTVKITDFGIARIESSLLTQAGTLMGTPAYMSPEQVNGETVDARTDLYSAGVLLYQFLTGERPFEGSMATIMHKVLNTVPPPPSKLSVTAPARLDPIVATAMARRPDQRFQSAAEFAAALARAFEGRDAPEADGTMLAPAAAENPTMVVRPIAPAAAPPAVPPRRGRAPVLAGLGGLLLLLAAGLGYVLTRPATTPERHAGVEQAPIPAAPAAPPRPAAPTPVPSPPPSPAPSPVPSPPAVVAVTPPPAAPAPAATAPAEPAPDAATLRASVARALAPIRCAMLGGEVGADGGVHVRGVIAADGLAGLRRTLRAALPAAPTIDVATFKGDRYCAVLDLLRPLAPAFGTSADADLALTLTSGGQRLKTDDYIVARVRMPDFPAYLTLDDFINDGGLGHLAFRHPDKPLAAGRTMTVGDPKPAGPADNLAAIVDGGEGWQVSPPFGTDLLVAIASERPLFDKPRGDETQAAYVRALAGAIEAAQRRNARLGAAVVLVPTGPE